MKLRKVISLVLVVLILSSLVSAYAVELDEDLPPDDPEPYIGVTSIGASLSINSMGKATCYGYVNLSSGYTATASLSLQQYNSGSWITIISWSATGGPTISIHGTHYVTAGYSYRAKITAVVYDQNGNYVETVSATSSTVYY